MSARELDAALISARMPVGAILESSFVCATVEDRRIMRRAFDRGRDGSLAAMIAGDRRDAAVAAVRAGRTSAREAVRYGELADHDAVIIGLEWWNSITRPERRYWSEIAGTGVPADAWAAFAAEHVAPTRRIYRDALPASVCAAEPAALAIRLVESRPALSFSSAYALARMLKAEDRAALTRGTHAR